MSAASQEMAASAETAIQAIEATTEAAVNNAHAANQISAIVEEQMAGIKEIDAAVDKLGEVIADLEQSIAFFKIQDDNLKTEY
jgi:methyl-accepting chemotaxis protein